MSAVAFQDLPLNIYMVIFGTGVFVFVLSLIFCCYFISKLRHQARRERFGYKAVSQVTTPQKSHVPEVLSSISQSCSTHCTYNTITS
uniref:RING finger protein 122 n=1 Tax=Oncorhynchus mykiss TaxID=8022 RepID=A0A8C7UL49_ONCMY